MDQYIIASYVDLSNLITFIDIYLNIYIYIFYRYFQNPGFSILLIHQSNKIYNNE